MNRTTIHSERITKVAKIDCRMEETAAPSKDGDILDIKSMNWVPMGNH